MPATKQRQQTAAFGQGYVHVQQLHRWCACISPADSSSTHGTPAARDLHVVRDRCRYCAPYARVLSVTPWSLAACFEPLQQPVLHIGARRSAAGASSGTVVSGRTLGRGGEASRPAPRPESGSTAWAATAAPLAAHLLLTGGHKVDIAHMAAFSAAAPPPPEGSPRRRGRPWSWRRQRSFSSWAAPGPAG